MRTLCRVLSVSRSSYYAWACGQTHSRRRDLALVVHIRAIHRHHKGRYGSPRVTQELRAQGMDVGRRRVARLMREQGLAGRPRRRFHGSTTDSTGNLGPVPNLLQRDFRAERPNRVLVGDITYVPIRGGWAYLAVLIDLFSRKVVGWAVEDHMEASLCLLVLRQVIATRGDLRGAIHHSDRGTQYNSISYRAALEAAGMAQSMSRTGDCWDNAVAESFFGTLKQESMPSRPWSSVQVARAEIGDYIDNYYNRERRHSTLGGISPNTFEVQHHAAKETAA